MRESTFTNAICKAESKQISKDFAYCEDTISRQAAIDALKNRWKKTRNYEGIGDDIAEECELYLKRLPSTQPEIIHCKECKYGVQDEGKRWYCRGLGCQVGEADGSGFCADAERRTDERSD